MKNNLSIILISLLLLAGCLYLGTDLSHRRPLGSDEQYTQTNTVERFAQHDLLSGKGLEGNNGPLYYVIQKLVTEQLGYVDQEKGNDGQLVHDERSQILLRRVSNAFMSCAIALTFFTVAWFYSVPVALLATIVFLTFPGTWLFWTHAQPYSLWILMSVLQSVFFLKTAHDRADKSRAWIWLLLVNILITFTNVLGVLQVCTTSLVVWAVNKKRWAHTIGFTLVSMAIGIYYLQRSNALKYWIDNGAVLDKFPLEYWALIPALLGVRFVHKRLHDDPWLRLDLWVLVCGFLLLRAVHTYIDILNSGTFWRLI